MAKTISFTLDAASIGKAIKELNDYTKDFEQKCKELRKRIAERIKWSAQQGFSTAMVGDIFLQVSGKEKSPASPIMGSSVQVNVKHEDNVSVVWTEGEDAVFIEYGAGVYHNGSPGDSPHPWGLEQGFVIGGYGKNHGTQNAWGYRDSDGNIYITHGTPAAMPIYRGAEEAIRAVGELIQEVFG